MTESCVRRLELLRPECLERMKPEGLSVDDGVVLITIMRHKAHELNRALVTDYWTPRRLDMVLWTYGR